jgi:hypothetical protein
MILDGPLADRELEGDFLRAETASDRVNDAAFSLAQAERIHHDVLLMMSGRLVLQLGPREHVLTTGEGATIPGGTPHRFFNDQSTAARLLMLVLPGGHEAYLSELASLQARGALTGLAMRQLSATYGVSILEGSAAEAK